MSNQSFGFSSSHVQTWELDHEGGWALKNWCFQTVVLERTLESPLDCKEIKPVHPKGDQSWIFLGRTDLKLKLQYFGHLIQRSDLLKKTLMLGKIEGGRRRGQQRLRWLDGIINSRTLLKLMSIALEMPSNRLILCHHLLLPSSIFPSIRVFSNELVLHIRGPKYWSFSFSISPSNEYSGPISFRIDWFDLAVQGTLKILLQHHS